MSIVGHCLTADAMPAFCASALIADGVMSGPATMYSCERLLLTVLPAVHAHHDGDDAERDEDGRCDEPSDLECLAHVPTPFEP